MTTTALVYASMWHRRKALLYGSHKSLLGGLKDEETQAL